MSARAGRPPARDRAAGADRGAPERGRHRGVHRRRPRRARRPAAPAHGGRAGREEGPRLPARRHDRASNGVRARTWWATASCAPTWRPVWPELGVPARFHGELPKERGGAADARGRPVRAAEPPRDLRLRADRGDGERAARRWPRAWAACPRCSDPTPASWWRRATRRRWRTAIERALGREFDPDGAGRARRASATATPPSPSAGPRSTSELLRAGAAAPRRPPGAAAPPRGRAPAARRRAAA